MELYFRALRKSFDFYGRASRKEYWIYVLFYYVFYFILVFISAKDMLEYVTLVYWLLNVIAVVSLTIRRLHDLGRNGWGVLWTFIPIIALFFILIVLTAPGEQGENNYGPDPQQRNSL
ncbi:DUF805 domain-containing protein [bacterium]|nr:DUF805 domain-containing protein [bacterium]